ncbi:hypothetical protein Ccar_15305 [Clostridium carboxidivorans P7]|uniref:Ig domain protein n=1 Tax=Clostridium carboxidivorans P7 TaxID=536227 RepID=C6Q0U4_9CLOT|nr:GDSL-type esterase/lipase family protein [Clostridium carboxidivorans]AKN32152.1 hypothetical protein Ccar_15305 [Clostridium carboxidivorans P7]EET84876.1 Ig domain protein [Clostridium carboxidivorans P7]
MKKIKLLVMGAILGTSLLFSSNVFAKASAIDVIGTDGKVYEYNYSDLKTSAMAYELNGAGDLGGKLYNDFLTRKSAISAYYDDVRKSYVDFNTASKVAVSLITSGQKFDLNSFLENPSTPTINLNPIQVTTTSRGNIVVGNADTIASISNTTAITGQGSNYSLPSTVQAIMSDGSIKNVTVTWDKQADTSQSGTFIFNGTVYGYKGNVVLILAVNANSSSLQKLDYVSLGDSLASGQTPYNITSGYGYTDIIAGNLANKGLLKSYSKYGVSGYTTADVLSQLKDTQVINSINNAEIVTIDIGANDLLSLLRAYLSGQNVDFPTQIGTVSGKISAIIQSIKTINPNAKIYIMGYYNALPNLSTQQETVFLQLLTGFNSSVKNVVDSFKDTAVPPVYVDTYESMNSNLKQYLPGDIHPTIEGYRIISEDFWNLIKVDSLGGLK